jgi:hypothetical protein
MGIPAAPADNLSSGLFSSHRFIERSLTRQPSGDGEARAPARPNRWLFWLL